MKNPFVFFRKKKIGLALGSGGARGIAHFAVLDYLDSEGIEIGCISGSSIGSVVAALYCSRNYDKAKKAAFALGKKDILMLIDPVFNGRGMINGGRIIKFLEQFISKNARIEDARPNLAIAATDYKTGKQVVFKKGNILKAIRASIAIPGVFMPASYRSKILIDGGISNPLPIDIVKSMGATKVIAVNLNPSLKRINESQAKFTKTKKHKPKVFEIMFKTVIMLESRITEQMLRQHKPYVLIEPMLFDVMPFDFLKQKQAYDEGLRQCKKNKKKLLRLK